MRKWMRKAWRRQARLQPSRVKHYENLLMTFAHMMNDKGLEPGNMYGGMGRSESRLLCDTCTSRSPGPSTVATGTKGWRGCKGHSPVLAICQLGRRGQSSARDAYSVTSVCDPPELASGRHGTRPVSLCPLLLPAPFFSGPEIFLNLNHLSSHSPPYHITSIN